MATTYADDVVFGTAPGRGGRAGAEDVITGSPYPDLPDEFVNLVWDPIDGYVRWRTYFIDRLGTAYPGSSAWATVAGSYCVEAIVFRRIEA